MLNSKRRSGNHFRHDDCCEKKSTTDYQPIQKSMTLFRRTRLRRNHRNGDTRDPTHAAAGETVVTRTPSSGNADTADNQANRDDSNRLPKLPHESDQTGSRETVAGPDPKVVQAHQDIENGIVDTDRRSAYGLGDGPPQSPRDAADTHDTEDTGRPSRNKNS